MNGSFLGNLFPAIYFMLFQFAGILLSRRLLSKECAAAKLIIGSTFGSLLLQWTPVLLAFFGGFTKITHLFALLVPAAVIAFCPAGAQDGVRKEWNGFAASVKRHAAAVGFAALLFLLWMYLLYTHTLRPDESGALHCGQCTYGDMSMHLGFLTSLAVQQTFPPQYSIFPGVRLAYPFLSDSISSSLYLFGASLQFAYILPMLAAFFQIMGGVYLLAYRVLQSRARAVFAWNLFFLNGGLGFAYFLDWSREREYQFRDIFTGYYTTPTNLVGHNIRWVNVVADMLLPQRATLFGYAVAIPCLYLLWRAVFSKEAQRRSYFFLAGLFTGALPMIHTHSFLAVGLTAASWLLLVLLQNGAEQQEKTGLWKIGGAGWLSGFLAVCLLLGRLIRSGKALPALLLCVVLLLAALLATCGVVLLVRFIRENGLQAFADWGIYLLLALGLSVPQLLFWTFGQVAEGGFVRGHFNWGNQGDPYLWFYLKNIGLPLLLIIGAILSGKRKGRELFLPAGLLWFLAELVVFTPNEYDNNKLLYLAYLMLLIPAADYAGECFARLKDLPGMKLLAAAFVFGCVFSGVLTLGREAVSDYQVYGASQVKLAEYIQENLPKDAVFLTNDRHVNEVAALAGRTVVCGADLYLYYHGIDTAKRHGDVRKMYENPGESGQLFADYHVKYLVVSPWETGSYAVDRDWISGNCTLLFQENDICLYGLP